MRTARHHWLSRPAVRAWRVRLAAARTAARLVLGAPRRGDGATLAVDLAAIGGVASISPTALSRRLGLLPGQAEAGRSNDTAAPAESHMPLLPPLLLDVRTPAEHARSHLPGAVRVEPTAPRLRLTPEQVAGRDVVVYCAVGVRSTLLALRHEAEWRRLGATDVLNLAGGIFAWHGQGLPLVDAAGPVSRVHPYNRLWGRLRRGP